MVAGSHDPRSTKGRQHELHEFIRAWHTLPHILHLLCVCAGASSLDSTPLALSCDPSSLTAEKPSVSSLGLNSRAISATRRAWLRPGTWGVSEGSPAEEANEGLAFGVAGAIAPPPRSMSVVSGAARCEPENERFSRCQKTQHACFTAPGFFSNCLAVIVNGFLEICHTLLSNKSRKANISMEKERKDPAGGRNKSRASRVV